MPDDIAPDVAAMRVVVTLGLPGVDVDAENASTEPLAPAEWTKFFGEVRLQRVAGLAATAMLCEALPVTDSQFAQLKSHHDAAMGWAI